MRTPNLTGSQKTLIKQWLIDLKEAAANYEGTIRLSLDRKQQQIKNRESRRLG